MRRAALLASLAAVLLAGGCRKMRPGKIAEDASPTAHVGQPYSYNAAGMVRTTRTPEDSFWFSSCGDDEAAGFAVAREGQVTFTPKEARTYHLCVALITAEGTDDTYEFDVSAAP